MMSSLAPARLWAATRFPYLASAIFAAQVSAAAGIGTVAVDDRWRLRVDPELAAGWTVAQFGSVLVHHASHLLRHHPERARAAVATPADARAWLHAADAEINDDLIPAGLDLPGHPVVPADFGAPEGRLAEEYFGLLRPGWKRPGEGEWVDCGAGADGQPRPWDSAAKDGAGKDGAAKDGAGKDRAGKDRAGKDRAAKDGGLDPWEADLLRRQVAQDVIRHAQLEGTVPAGLARWAAGVLSPQVDWRRLLAAEVRRAVADVAGAVDYSSPAGRAGRRPCRLSSCPRSAGRSRRSPWCATPQGA